MAALTTKLKKKAMLEALYECLGVVTSACESVGIDRKTHYNWLEKDEAYKKAVNEMQNVALDFVECELFSQIQRGEPASTIFYLKTKGKARGYIERQELVIPPADQATMIVLPSGREVSLF